MFDDNIRSFLDGKTVNRRVRVMRASYFGHVQRRPESHLLQHAFRYRASKKKVGRPCLTWLDSLRQDRQKYSYHYDEWLEAAKDKSDIKKMAETIYETCENDSSQDEPFQTDDEE